MYNAYGGSARASGAQTAQAGAGARSGAASRTAARSLPAFSVAFVPPNAVFDTGSGGDGGSAGDYGDNDAEAAYAYADERDLAQSAYGGDDGYGYADHGAARTAARAWRDSVGRVAAPPAAPGAASATSAAPTAAALPSFSTSAPLGFSSAHAATSAPVTGAPVDASSALGVSERELALLEALRIARDKYRGARKMLRAQGSGTTAGDAALGRTVKPDASGADPSNAKVRTARRAAATHA